MSLIDDFQDWLLEPTAEPTRIVLVLVLLTVSALALGSFLPSRIGEVRRRIRRLVNPYDVDIMNGDEFEEFLGELFRRLGFHVQRIGGSGDYGVDLIITHPVTHERIAVQAKCYSSSVGIAAVQEVYFGATFHGCNRALVVTNSDFTMNAHIGAERVTAAYTKRQASVPVFLIGGVELKARIAQVFGVHNNQVA